MLKERPEGSAESTVFLSHVEAPDTQLRLQKALELLLTGDATIGTDYLMPANHDREKPDDNGDDR